jgi:uncharacterized protein (DUF488 family)
MQKTQAPLPIYTIGYGARTIDAFVQLLKANRIAYLLDVRSAPYSRYKPEFSRVALEEELRRQGLQYVYMGDRLGGRPDDPDCYADGKVLYDQVKQKDFFLEGLSRVRKAFEQGRRVVLMCSEGKPENCHRSVLIGETLTDLNIPVLHIDENDDLRTQAEIIARRTGGQLSLLGEHSFTSRKRYSVEEGEDDEDEDDA